MSRKKIVPKKPEATGFLVVDGLGGFKPVTVEQLLEAARELATKRLARGTPLNSPSEVRECLPYWGATITSVSGCCSWTARIG